MNKLWLVAQREYVMNARRPAFLFAVFGAPLFTFFVWFIIFALIGSSEGDIERIGQVGYVDAAAVLTEPALALEDYPDLFVAYDSEAAARAALDAQTIGAYFLVPQDYMRQGIIDTYSYTSIPGDLNDRIEEFLQRNLSRLVSEEVPLERIFKPVDMTIHVTDSGRDLTSANIPALIFMPLIFAMVFLMSSGVTSGFLMNGVVEEKTTRIMEILVTSITPMQMLLGKVLGLGALGLTQLVVWGVAGALLLNLGQSLPLLQGIVFPTDMALIFLVYFLLSYFLLASLMAGIGVVAGSEQESRQWSSVISTIWVIPFFFIVTFFTDANGVVPVALSLIPFTAPLTMLMRLGFGVVPAWQIIASLSILLVTTLFVIWGSARVFRWGLLLYGKQIGLREIIRVVRQPPDAGTVAAQSKEANT